MPRRAQSPTTSSTRELAKLNPPRKYYQNYQRTRGANDNMLHAPQGLHAFFRAYYHYKSADWKGNNPHPLKARTAEEMAQIPTYYVMEKDKGMAETVAPFMPSAAEIAACKWLTEAEVEVYATEYGRTGFTGALQGYRVRRGSDPRSVAEMLTFSGRTIDVPSMYIAGKSDWGVYQTPGAVDKMRTSACTHMVGFHLLDGAGHWVQQEQPEQVSTLLVASCAITQSKAANSMSMITPHSSAVRLNNLGVRYHAEGKFHESNVAHKECSAILEAGGPETLHCSRRVSRIEPRSIEHFRSITRRSACFR